MFWQDGFGELVCLLPIHVGDEILTSYLCDLDLTRPIAQRCLDASSGLLEWHIAFSILSFSESSDSEERRFYWIAGTLTAVAAVVLLSRCLEDVEWLST